MSNTMNYFTPELYEQYNSADEATVLAAHKLWDDAAERYRTKLSKWIESAPAGVRDLALRFNGHDAWVAAQGSLGWSSFHYLYLSAPIAEFAVCYQLLATPVSCQHNSKAACWSADPIWLYDEVSRTGPSRFRHEILFGDGRILHVEFSDVAVQSWVVKQSATAASRPRIELMMPPPQMTTTSLAAVMKLWSKKKRPATTDRRSLSSAKTRTLTRTAKAT
jgi:hypothetical protein